MAKRDLYSAKEKPKKTTSPETALLRMASLCSKSEQAEADICEKLTKLQIKPADILNIINQLKERNFLNNARFAKAYANDKLKFSGWGKKKIHQGLLNKKIASSDIKDALNNLDYQLYLDTIMKVGKTKSRNLNLQLKEDQAKLYRFLTSRGFESDLSIQLIEAFKELKRMES